MTRFSVGKHQSLLTERKENMFKYDVIGLFEELTFTYIQAVHSITYHLINSISLNNSLIFIAMYKRVRHKIFENLEYNVHCFHF